MSFSYDVKTELCRSALNDGANKQVCLFGMLLFLRRFSLDCISYTTEHEEIANLFLSLISEVINADIPIKISSAAKKDNTVTFTFSIDDTPSIMRIIEYYKNATNTNLDTLDCDYLRQNDETIGAFLKGIYLIGGSMMDPQKEYHLEIMCPSKSLADGLERMLFSIGFKSKITERKGNSVLYIKESEQIEDFLTFIGATNATIELMNIKVYKNIINKVNRITNCELANINRTLDASKRQAVDIRYVLSHKAQADLSDELIELAELRLENTDTSLKDLGKMLSRPISKSGVNHRLEKISRIAAQLREKNNEEAYCDE